MSIKAEPSFSLKDALFNADTLALLATGLQAADPGFKRNRFEKQVLDRFADLELKERINDYLSKGMASITMEEAFKVALYMERSELDVIYKKLLKLGGPDIAKSLGYLIVPASVQRQKLKSAVLRFSKDPELHAAVMALKD